MHQGEKPTYGARQRTYRPLTTRRGHKYPLSRPQPSIPILEITPSVNGAICVTPALVRFAQVIFIHVMNKDYFIIQFHYVTPIRYLFKYREHVVPPLDN